MLPSDDVLPQWPKKLFQNIPKLDSIAADRDYIFSAYALGILDQALDGSGYYYLASALQRLCFQAILHTEVHEDILFFKMDSATREEIWDQTSAAERSLALFDLLNLIIHSYPDFYSEFLWRKVAACCDTVVESTIAPYISVLDWSQLEHHHSM